MRRYWAGVRAGTLKPISVLPGLKPKRLPVKLFSNNPLHFAALEGRSRAFKRYARFINLRFVRNFSRKKLFLFELLHLRLRFTLIYKKPT